MKGRDELTKEFSNKVYWMRLLCAALVVGAHCNNQGILNLDSDSISVMVQVAVNTYIYSLSIPIFFIFSGFFFYYNMNEKMFFEKWKKRFAKTLYLYLIWNIIYTCYKLVKTNIGFLAVLGRSHEVTALNMENILKGIFLHEYSVPWWFMLQLVVLELMAPLIWKALQKKSSARCLAALILLLAIFSEAGLVRIPYIRLYSFVYYFVGVFVGFFAPHLLMKCWGKTLVHRVIPIAIGEVCLYLCHRFMEGKFDWVIMALLSLFMWNLFNGFDIKHECKDSWRISFLVYAVHPFIVGIVYQVEKMVIPINEITSLVLYLLNPILILVVIKFIAVMLKKMRLYKVLTTL